MVKKYKFTLLPVAKPEYLVVEYLSIRPSKRKVLAKTYSKSVARKKAISFANKKQSSNIYVEVQIAGTSMK